MTSFIVGLYFEYTIFSVFNEEEKRYFIDIFAAFALKLLPYDAACEMSDNGARLFEISPELLELLKEVFKDHIHYVYLETKKENNYPNVNQLRGDDSNNKIFEEHKTDIFNDKEKKDFYEKIGTDVSYKDDINSMFNEIPEDYQDTDVFRK